MDPAEKDRLERGEIGAMMHRLDLALYSCWLVMEGKQDTELLLTVKGNDKIVFPSSRTFIDVHLDAGAIACRKILQFFGVSSSGGILGVHRNVRSTDVRITDWPGSQLLTPSQVKEVLQPDFTPIELEGGLVDMLHDG